MPRRPVGPLVLALVSSVIILYVLYTLRHAWLMFYVATVLAVMFDPIAARALSLDHPRRFCARQPADPALVGGQALLMLTHGGSALVTFWLLGLPYFAAIALFAALINVIPFLGAILTLIVAGLIAAIEAPGKLLGVLIFYLAYHNIEGALLQPRIMAPAVGVPGVAVIAALVIGYDVAGIVGMVIAVPTAVLIAEFRTVLRDG